MNIIKGLKASSIAIVTLVVGLLLSIVLLSGVGTAASVNSVAVNNTCATDVTASLNSIISKTPNGSTLQFNGCYRIDGTIEFRGKNLTFAGNNSTFKSTKPMVSGNYDDDQRAMFRPVESTVKFSKMTIVGAYSAGPVLDETLQHSHAIDLRGTNAQLSSLKIRNFAGDCVYFGLGYDSTTKSTGSFHNSTCSNVGRNGVSFTASSATSVYSNTISSVGFTTFDVEPNVGPGWGTSKTSITSNTVNGSYRLYTLGVIENAPNDGVTFSSNHVTGPKGLRVGIIATNSIVRPTSVVLQNNTATAAQAPPAVDANNVDGLTVTGNTIPMTGGVMAQVNNSCQVNVSGNSYPGGSAQLATTGPVC